MTINTAKLLVAIALLASVTVLLSLGKIDPAAGYSTITAVTFYMLGNGVTTLKGKVAEPIVSPTDARNVATPPQTPLHVTAPATVVVHDPAEGNTPESPTIVPTPPEDPAAQFGGPLP